MEVNLELAKLRLELTKYLLNPKVHPYPLTASKRLDKVTWNFQGSEYQINDLNSCSQTVQRYNLFSARVTKTLRYLVVIGEIFKCFQLGREGYINKREIYYKNIKIFES